MEACFASITVVVGGIFRFQTKHATISAESVKPTVLNQSKAEVQAEPEVQAKANPRQQQKSRGAGGAKAKPKPQDTEQADGAVA